MAEIPRDPVTMDDDAADRLWAIADELSAAGLTTHLRCTRGVLDLSATMYRSGHRETDVIVDEDGYTELHYWADPAATPAQVAYAITTALTAVTADLPGSAHSGQGQTARHAASLPAHSTPSRVDDPITGYDGAVTERAGDGVMAGPQDRLADQQTSPDQVRPRAPDSVNPELVKRMERLPHGHPSSPYNADGTGKPPVPNPFANDYPIPGDPGYRADASDGPEVDPPHATSDSANEDFSPGVPDQGLPTEGTPLTGPDGSWKWHGRELPPHACQIADTLADRCREAEGRDADGNYGERGLTPTMYRIEAQLDHGHLADRTEEYALKTADRFKEKLATLIARFPGADPRELAEGIHDGVRYTFIFGFEHYTESVALAQVKISEAGYERIETKPGWHGDEYKGVNSQWADTTSGLRFEVQFHTQESWDAKQVTHDAYEKINALSTPIEEKEGLRAYQREVSSRVRTPPGALDIQAYKKDGR